jgi:hypothetical protein
VAHVDPNLKNPWGAGLNSENDGLFGMLTPVASEEDGSIE